MTAITHHIPDELLIAYAAGNLSSVFSLAVAAHVSMCDSCRAQLGAHEALGGTLLEETPVAAVSQTARTRVFDALDAPVVAEKPQKGSGIFPAPIMTALGGVPPKWKPVGLGVRQMILSHGRDGSARLLYIPGGQGVPDHGHNGLELTLVLQGAFRDETGRFGVGDLEVADGDLEHEPVAEDGPPCICLAATDASLRFRSFVPRLLQPFFRI